MKTKLRIITYNILRFLPLAILVLAVVLGCVLPFVVHDRHQVVTVYADEPERLPAYNGQYFVFNSSQLYASSYSSGASLDPSKIVDSDLSDFGFFVPVSYLRNSSSSDYFTFWGIGLPSLADSRSIYSALSSEFSVSYGVVNNIAGSSGFSGYSASDPTTSWSILDRPSHYSLYPFNTATASSLSYQIKSHGGSSSDSRCIAIFRFPDFSAFDYSHFYTIRFYSSWTDTSKPFGEELSFDTGVFFNATGLFVELSSMPSGYYCFVGTVAMFSRPSFVPASMPDSSISIPFSAVVTPSSFYDLNSSKYVYPFPSLDLGEVPSPPPSSDEYNAGYQAGYDSGYDSGYSEGYNKGQTEQLTNPANFFLQPAISFMQTDLFGSFSLGDAFQVVMFVLVAIIFIKLFAGG